MYICKIKIVSLIFACLFALAGCVTFTQNSEATRKASELFNKGEYHQATLFAAHAVRLAPTSGEALQWLTSSYSAAIKYYVGKIDGLKGSVDIASLNKALSYYQKIGELNTLINKSDKAVKRFINVAANLFENEIFLVHQQLAKAHYQKGLRFEKLADRDAHILAAKHFQLATKYQAGFKDSQSRFEKHRSAAMRRVAIVPFFVDSKFSEWAVAGELVTAELAKNLENEFLTVISGSALTKAINKLSTPLNQSLGLAAAIELAQAMNADYLLSGAITKIDSKPANIIEQIKEQKSFDTIKRFEYTDVNGKKGWAIGPSFYKALVGTFVIDANAKIGGNYKLINANGSQITDTLHATDHYFYTWSTLADGDKMALNWGQRKDMTRVVKPVPRQFFIVKNASENLANLMTESIYQKSAEIKGVKSL